MSILNTYIIYDQLSTNNFVKKNSQSAGKIKLFVENIPEIFRKNNVPGYLDV